MPPTQKALKDEIIQMVSLGELLLGQPCSPHNITQLVVKDGNVTKQTKTVQGRKIIIHELRTKLLQLQEPYMHLYSDDKIKTMDQDELQQHLSITSDSVDKMRELLATKQRTRTLVLWHDHATLLGRGYILLTIHTLYDDMVFKSDEQITTTCSSKAHIQTLVEQPMVYLIALNSSSIDDQVAIIPDRVECLYDLNQPIVSSKGIEVRDILKFFTGDHPSQQFERGTQMGGTFKCGGCGCKDSLMDDQAHALRCHTRQLHELQTIALGGVLGHVPCVVKPLYVPELSITSIRQQLRARGFITNLHEKRAVLQKELQEILQGVQRVPSLLFLKPEQELSEINLTHYHILDCEPLHDIKGHLLHLFIELPSILPPSIKNMCSECIQACLAKEKKVQQILDVP